MASTPATTTDPACCATSVATRVTRAIGVELRDEVARPRLLLPRFDVDAFPLVEVDDFPLAALRVDEPLLALRFVLEALLPIAWERLEPALLALLDVLAADRPRDFLAFVPDLLALRDELLLLDFPRDFLALVAIGGLLGVVGRKIHLDDSKNQAHP
jgi:hypothetical protein